VLVEIYEPKCCISCDDDVTNPYVVDPANNCNV